MLRHVRPVFTPANHLHCAVQGICVLSFPCASHLCVLSAPLPVISAVQLQGICALSLSLATDLHCEG